MHGNFPYMFQLLGQSGWSSPTTKELHWPTCGLYFLNLLVVMDLLIHYIN